MAFLPPEPRPPAPLAGPPYGPPAGPVSAPPARGTVLGLHSRQWMVVALVLGCCYLAFSAVGIGGAWVTLNREPTNAELQRAANAEVARRWRAWPAGRIFPERLAYEVDGGRSEFASRLGISGDSRCESGVDVELGAVLRRHGCRAVLRATYADALQGVVVTVGVAAFPDPWKADAAFREIPASTRSKGGQGVRPALRALAFPGTAAARFTDLARQDRTSDRGGPYVVLTVSGQADGRPAAAVPEDRPDEPFLPAPQLARAVAKPLSVTALPDCSKREWRC
ncbi:hypothetical protein [Actinomadura kijaniata]|uniref:hypothetical protein n=1 Tax=Actinomadura kijaniata TaxID=46161 RepID=UPI0012F77F45|nr:hypothetical protein [Actinomadura kijaniata]